MNLMELVIASIMFVVLGFTLSIGQSIQGSQAQTSCTNAGYNWGAYQKANWSTGNGTVGNPYDKTFTGCCYLGNGTYNSSVCQTWLTTRYDINASYYGMSSNDVLASWLPIIALAMAAGFVIAILITYLLGAVIHKQSASI